MNSEEKLNKINENKKNNHYTKEIQQLLDMGFDKEKAIDAIEFTRGNIELAIDYLYNGFPKHDNNNNSMDCNLGDEDNDSEREEHGEDFEDTIQYYAAKWCGAEYIITRNERDYPYTDIPAVSPTTFLKLIGAE